MNRALISFGMLLCFAWLGHAQGLADHANAVVAGEKLTPDELGKMLTNLALEPKDNSKDKNRDVYLVSIDHDGWKVPITVSLSTNRNVLWLEIKTPPLPTPGEAGADAWLRLLELSSESVPAHFAYDKESKRLHLYKPFPNQGWTPKRLREEIANFDSLVRRTVSAWDPKNFAPKQAVPGKNTSRDTDRDSFPAKRT
jgi:hypothetical protein